MAWRAPGPAASPAGAGPPGAAAGYEVVRVVDGGAVSGRVLYDGPAPAAPPSLPVTSDVEACGPTVPDDRLAVAPDGGLAGAVVSLDGADRGKAGPSAPALLRNAGCRFVPHVQGTMLGQRISIVNDDPVLHNVHAVQGGRTLWNVALPLQGLLATRDLPDRAGAVEVRCDVHPWMGAWVLVFPHPYFDTTGADGGFALEDVPPGTYTLRVWHETLGEARRQVRVRPGSRVDLRIRLPQGSGAPRPGRR